MTRNFDVAAGRSCACDSISETLQPAQDYGPETLLAITHVCTYWRGVAVSHSSLWSHVTFDIERDSDFADGPNCPQNWLRRARSAPLYVHLDGEPPNRRMGNRKADSVVNQLRPHLNKIIGVRFTTGWTYSMTRQFLLKILAQGDADSLREFIHLGGSSPWGDQELLLASSSHPSHNLESPMPSLRVLDLKETCFAWDSPIYRNLINLRLDFLDGASFPTIPQLLGVLCLSRPPTAQPSRSYYCGAERSSLHLRYLEGT
ncbi:hypothetical protein BDV93DRAFT_366491 [Ceratobasidium sp. AG-I]|nr:hypothetical protein BDV93DRAFT_366491 [Ceratobasidium sp. AG-I]